MSISLVFYALNNKMAAKRLLTILIFYILVNISNVMRFLNNNLYGNMPI